MNQYLKLEGKLIWLFGKSGSGKSSFFINHLLARWSDGPVYVKAKDEKEWEDKKVELLKADFDIEHIKSLPNNCLIFFDDFVKTCNDKKFQEIVNYNLRHECKTLILCIHDVFKSGLYNDLIQSSHFFITYCPGSLKLLQILDKQYKFNFRSKFQEHYAQGIIKHYIAFLNTDSQTFFPAFNILLEQTGSTEMFNFDESQVVFHSKNMACPNVAAVSNEEGLLETDSLPLHLYPKWEKRARYVLKIIKAMIDDQNCLKGTKISVLDFLKMAVNRSSLPQQLALHKKKFTTVLKKMKAEGIRLPESIVQNSLAQKYIC